MAVQGRENKAGGLFSILRMTVLNEGGCRDDIIESVFDIMGGILGFAERGSR